MDDDDQYLWPLSSSPLFVPQSPTPSTFAFTYDAMRRQQTASPTRRGSRRPTDSLNDKRKHKTAHQPSNTSSFASASGSASSSDSSTLPSLSNASGQSSASSSRARGQRPAVRTSAHSQRNDASERSVEAERPSKRRRISTHDTAEFLEYGGDAEVMADDAFFGMTTGLTAEADFDDIDDLEHFDFDQFFPAPVIDLTDDGPEVPMAGPAAPPTRTQNTSRYSSLYASRSPSRLGSRTAPILIDDLDLPPAPRRRTATPVVSAFREREASVEILDNIVAKQQEDAVAAQSGNDDEAFTTFNNMTCVICMDSPRNLSMVPCGHVFCGACITEALRHSESRTHEHTGQRKAACPVCREPVWRSRKDHVVPILLKKGLRRPPAQPVMV